MKDYNYIDPNHYKKNSIEVIDMMTRIWGPEAVATYCEINAFKYRMRLGMKPNQPIEQELKKAQWYEQKSKQLRDEIINENVEAQKCADTCEPTDNEMGDLEKKWTRNVVTEWDIR